MQNDPEVLIGRCAVHFDFLSREQTEKALRAWQAAPGDEDFGNFLVAEDYLEPEMLEKLLHVRDRYQQQQNGNSAAALVVPVSPVAEAPVAKTAIQAMNGHTPAPSSVTTIPLTAAPPRVAPGEQVEPIVSFEEKSAANDEVKVQTTQADLLRYGPGVTLQNLLEQTSELNASDLHVHSGATLRVRLNGELVDATSDVLTSEECRDLINGVTNEFQNKRIEEESQVDFTYQIPGVGRYRANVYKQQRGMDAVFRTIKPTPPTLAELGLPKDLKRYTEFHQGLVLFTGPAGCGKSSTMAAMVDLVNKSHKDHILTIEDPIEYVHTSASCNVSQREVGTQTESFSRALRAALREDPDVIVIGELRDLETIALALTAAETGHLVMATLHTSNAIRTINRLLGVFPPDQQAQIRMMLSESLKVVVSQRMVRRADHSGRVPALEVMINNNAIGNLIRENRTFQIRSIMQTGGAQGQLLLDASLSKLLKANVITKDEAIKHAEDPRYFK